jgi:hypothetical protein
MQKPKNKKIDFSDIAEWTAADFSRARRSKPEERARFRIAYLRTFGHPPPKRGPVHKPISDRYIPTYIKLHPKVVAWAKREAKRRGVGYQTVINQSLLHRYAA